MGHEPRSSSEATAYRGTMKTPIMTSLLVSLLAILTVNSIARAAIADFDDDAFARLRDRRVAIPTFAGSPLDTDDAFWLATGTGIRIGLFGEHLEPKDDRFRVGSRTTLGLATSAAPFGRPADLFGVSATLDDFQAWGPREDREPAESPGITAFYGWRLTPAIVLQPALSWQDGERGTPDRLTALLGVRIGF